MPPETLNNTTITLTVTTKSSYNILYTEYSAESVQINPTGCILSDSQSQHINLPNTEPPKTPCLIPITALNRELRFIDVVMVNMSRCEEGDFVAECPKFNIFAFGDTYEEALDNLKEVLIEDYNTYLEDYPDKLSNSGKSLLHLYLYFLGKDLPTEE